MPRNKSFIYSNSKIRVGEESPSHREGSRTLEWYEHSSDLWGSINWNQVKTYVDTYCHGTTRGAQIIEKTLNVLDKYTGKNRQTSIANEDLAYGITQDLIDNLGNLSMGRSGSAQSLLKYITSNEKGATNTAQNAGFSFENRMSEFIQRIAGEKEITDIKALKTGDKPVFAGESLLFYLGDHTDKTNLAGMTKYARGKLTEEIMKQTGIDFKNLVSYVYEEVQRNIDGKIQPDIAVVAYKVPQKADITTKSYLTINADYGSLINTFLGVISNSRLSLKNTSESTIKIGSTNDNTRLRSFISQFAQKIDKSFASTCTFIFASKASGSRVVKKYLDWARILYELLGTGQHISLTSREDILVDYLIINSYNPNGQSGQATVFNVKDLIKNFPTGEYNPPFNIYGGEEHTGEVVLNLNKVSSFNFG